ncbi:non-ribosomal peptide synthetase module [Aspergillus oryzae 3.042]|uniref:Non-ribosomal peptide synthetase module n=1 Tax=Aspergillus oryzae (strain 3.042) TaxID=1160506 RepID=I8U3D6_ASPO3|nr:non-ribosomal peptide synthetase module [Aspergillus oryzae 3.042]|eukprot:EIT81213.1 non-ribosomal peptide synthetase module [Aspergillus oryzae 3.042]
MGSLDPEREALEPTFAMDTITDSIQQAKIPLTHIQTAHAASKLQEEMILATMMDVDHQVYLETYHFTTTQKIQATQLSHALQRLIEKHAILRSLFCWDDNGNSTKSTMVRLVVLDTKYLLKMGTFIGYNAQNANVVFYMIGSPFSAGVEWSGELPWKISLSQSSDQQGSRLTLSFHHAILDGTSARQLLLAIQNELDSPASVVPQFDIFAANKALAKRCNDDTRAQIKERFAAVQIKPNLQSMEPGRRSTENFRHAEQTSRIETRFPPYAARAAVPAWIARLALSMALCSCQGVSETVFLEIMSGRKALSQQHQEVLGPLLAPQIRHARFPRDTPLSDAAQSLKSTHDVEHGFSVGQLKSLLPELAHHIDVSLVCQTDMSYPSNGVGGFLWDYRETKTDIPLVVELLPPREGFFHVSIRYHQSRYTDDYITRLLRTFGGYLQWLQGNHTHLSHYTFHHRSSDGDPLLNIVKRHEIDAIPQEQLHCSTEPHIKTEVGVHEIFELQAKRTPQKIALQYENSQYMTYADLNLRCDEMAGALAYQIGRLVPRPADYEEVVAIWFEKSIDMIIAIMSILKAGLAYVVIDVNHPAERIAHILELCKASIILCGNMTGAEKLSEIARRRGASIFTLGDLLNEQNPQLGQRSLNKRREGFSASSLACVHFTSGTTGVPKGIMIEHRNIAAVVRTKVPGFMGDWTACQLQLTGPTFDIIILDVFGTLGCGGRLILGSTTSLLSSLPQWLEKTSVTHLCTTPAVASAFNEQIPVFLRVITLGGEVFHPSLLRDTPKECRIFNGYGPSETTVVATLYKTDPSDQSVQKIPVGLPYGRSRIYVVVPQTFQQVAVGEIGEIIIGGPQVTRGYLGNPELTASKFQPSPFPDSKLVYRTGDFGRFLPDGTLDYIGRIDNQVKLRGQRIEVEEAEAVITMHSRVKACAVVKADTSDGGCLAAFVELHTRSTTNDQNGASGELSWSQTTKELMSKASQTLPEYMVPAFIFQVKDRLPHTMNGKVDRRGLSNRATKLIEDEAQLATASYSEPQSKAERVVCNVFGDVLSCRVGVDDNLLNMGGHSITAIRAATRINHELNLEITFRDILQFPTPRSLCARIYQPGESTEQSEARKPRLVRVSEPVELSSAQSRLWFLDQLHQSLSWYLMILAFRVRGPLRLDALEAAFLALEQRHETLRTTFEQKDGVTVQVVHPFQHRPLRVTDINGSDKEQTLHKALLKEQTTPFNLTREPGWRPSVFRIDSQNHVISIVIHHIIGDGWSMGIVLRELAVLYAAAISGSDPMTRLTPLPLQYPAYSVWQRQEEQLAKHRHQLKYWSEQLQGSQPAEFFCDKARPSSPSGNAEVRTLSITGEIYDQLRSFCQSYQVTPFVPLLAAFRAAHYRLCGTEDATVGTPITNRSRAEHEGIIGLIVNVQCIRIRISETDSFDTLTKHVRDTVTAAFDNEEVPFEDIVSELQPTRATDRNPLVQTVFAVHPEGFDQISLEGLYTERINVTYATRFDLEVHFYQHADGLAGEIMYATDLFHSETIQAISSVFMSILQYGVQSPNTKIDVIPLMQAPSTFQDVDIVGTPSTDYPKDISVVELFGQQVAASPSAVAVKDSSCQLTYAELDHQSDRICHWLMGQGLPAETIVAVFSQRSCQTIVTFMGILKASMAYLPLDERVPDARIEVILASLQDPRLILVGSGVRTPVVGLKDVMIMPILGIMDTKEIPPVVPVAGPSASSLAYVIFTSGSTGQPKGVMIEHKGIVSRMKRGNTVSESDCTKAWAHLSSIAFDASVLEIYTPLLNGGSVICIDTMTVLDYAALEQTFSKTGVRCALLTPAMLKQLLSESPDIVAQLDTLVVGGDRADPQDMFRAQRLVGSSVINAYGPTENTIVSTAYCMSKDSECSNGVPIGRAINNSGAYVMDQELRPVPLGVMGELVVVGDGLARGYTDPERNGGLFVTITISGHSMKAYRTGDRVRYRPVDGELEYFGRLNDQVKIRGHRVELGEIEQALLDQGSLAEAVVVLQRSDADDDTRLVAFVREKRDVEDKEHNNEQQQEEGWKEIFSTAVYDVGIQSHQVGRDFSGWTSMYDGTNIDKGEMNEWLDDTISTLLDGRPPGNVLEVGTGSGMILFNIPQGLRTYVGLEPAQPIVDFVQKTIHDHRGDLNDKVRLHTGTAADVGKIAEFCTAQPDLVVVNSVAQYFPGGDYLARTIGDLLKEHKAKTLFFGDMRSYALYRQFQVSKALHILEDKAEPSVIRKIMAETVENETELLVDPGFFTALPHRFPGLIRHVEILPKKMRATNELSCYRYSAVIHTVHGDHPLSIYTVESHKWIDFVSEAMDQAALIDILSKRADDTDVVAVANIPHEKTIVERVVLESLENQPQAWQGLTSIRDEAHKRNSLSVIDLINIASMTGFRVEVSWARQFSQDGGFDAIFHRIQSEQNQGRAAFQFPTDHEGRHADTLTNNPMLPGLRKPIEQTLREGLQQRLPSYMVPSIIKVLDQLPINHSGKVDRKRLAQMTVTVSPSLDEIEREYVAPRDDLERTLCEEFGNILGSEVGIMDNFFNLGGHSLMATRAVSKIIRRLGSVLNVRDLFDYPTPAQLARRISSERDGEMIEPTVGASHALTNLAPNEVVGWREAVREAGLHDGDIERVMPCTPFQEGVLTSDIVLEGRSAYQAVVQVTINSALDLEALSAAWRITVKREEMLRTAFLPSIDASNQQGICGRSFLQTVFRDSSVEVQRVATIQGGKARSGDIQPQMDMGKIPVSLELDRERGSSRWSLRLKIHHALYDGQYLSSIIQGLVGVYKEGSTLCKSSHKDRVSFSTFVRTLQDGDPDKACAFWKDYLKGGMSATWPVTNGLKGPMAVDRSPKIKIGEWAGDARKIAKRFQITPAAMARAALALTIAEHSNSDDVILGEVSSGRYHTGFVAGPCIATHPVRINMAKQDTFQSTDNTQSRRISLHSLLKLCRDTYLDTMHYQQVGLESIRLSSESPDLLPFQVLFVYQEAGPETNDFTISQSEQGRVDFPLVFEVSCHSTTGHLSIRCVFDPVIFPPGDIDWVMQHVIDALSLIADQAIARKAVHKHIDARLVISANERAKLQQLASKQDVVANDPDQTVIDIISQQAEKAPEKIALQFEQDQFLTYRQLLDSATMLAGSIERMLENRMTDVDNQPLIPIAFDKSSDMVIVILAILKAGAAFIPLDMNYPIKRLQEICELTQPPILIWDGINGSEKINSLTNATGAVAYTIADLRKSGGPVSGGNRPTSLNSLAYILFTSGSTGVPKGVMVEHRNLTAFTMSEEGSVDCSWTSNRLSFLAYTFDASMGDLFATLCKGGRFSLVRRSKMLSQLNTWLDNMNITHLALTPTLGGLLPNDLREGSRQLPHLRNLVFGGEPFRASFLRRTPVELTVWNGYGPSETTIEATACQLQGPSAESERARAYLPIGSPTGGCRIYILRPETEEPVPIGAIGEICIGGPQVARGYLGQPDLTACRFTPDPFAPSREGRMFRTGDLGRFHSDGNLEYLDREDGQVKLRGLRIDINEVESVAQTHPAVTACVVAKAVNNDSEALIAFVELSQSPSINGNDLMTLIKDHISRSVPDYMVPAHLLLPQGPLPRTAHGKTNKLAIQKMANAAYEQCMADVSAGRQVLVPAIPGTLEATIASVWAKVLGIKEDRVDITMPFSKLGGDSIRSITLLALLRRAGLRVDMADVAPSSTIQVQAVKIRDRTKNGRIAGNLHVHDRGGRATIVLIHPFLAQSTIFEPLVPLLDRRLNVILVDDPFFGTDSCPATLAEWATSYLINLKPHLIRGQPVIFGGYSVGGLIAFEMAQLWGTRYGSHSASVVLLDPGTYEPINRTSAGNSDEEIIRNSLGMSDVEPEDLAPFREHFDRHIRVLQHSARPALYQGRCLYLGLPERFQDGTAAWWKNQCPNIVMNKVDCDNHYKMLKGRGRIQAITQYINEYSASLLFGVADSDSSPNQKKRSRPSAPFVSTKKTKRR